MNTNTLEYRTNKTDQLEIQREFLELMNQYNNTDRKVIKQNLKRIIDKLGLERKDIIKLGYTSTNVYSWFANVNNNIPMLEQALTIACEFDFDVYEFLKEI
jgi:hypothetical protein